jgi:broad specificity phosphatase PhoE
MGLIGSLLSFPYIILFFTIWLAASLLRPVSLACFFIILTKPKAALRRLQLFATSIEYLLLCNDKKWKAPIEDPESFFPDVLKADQKTIIFVRHGESTWNDTFNRGDRSMINFVLFFVPNLIKSLLFEVSFIVSGQEDESWFFDSPLSQKGLQQALGVKDFLKQVKIEYETPREAELIKIMLGETPSQLVASNLRRAISTSAIAFQDRLEQNMDQTILVVPLLQEMSHNPDALCITPPHEKVKLAWTDPEDLQDLYNRQVDTKQFHTGNKPVNSNGLTRMQDFCRFVFDDIKDDNIIITGHSIWFRSFFRTFLPHGTEHVGKKKKLINGGCIGFSLLRMPDEKGGKGHFMIDPKSMTVLYGGF